MQTTKKPFRPWVVNLVWSGYGLVFVWMSFHFFYDRGQMERFVIAFALSAAFTVWNWKNVVRRSHGQRVESAAVRDLSKALSGIPGASIRTGVALHKGGDADAVVTIAGRVFNIEIKSVESPSRVSSAHAKQAASAGRQLKSIPVIWLPRSLSDSSDNFKGVLLVCGGAKTLVKHLGAAQ